MTIEEIIAETTPCLGDDCGKKLIKKYWWRQVPNADKPTLRALGYTFHEGRGLCGSCKIKHRHAGDLFDRFPPIPQPVPTKEQFDIPAIWAEIQEEKGMDVPALASRLGIGEFYARQLLNELSLPVPPNKAAARRDEQIEEINFLHSCGCGVYEIAKKLDLDPDALITRVTNWRDEGHDVAPVAYVSITETQKEY